jgi:dTDP-4-dehydrorhamnose reductase
MRILLTGSSGMLGGAIRSAAINKGWVCEPLIRSAVVFIKPVIVKELIADCDVLIHAAANTNVEECEINPEDCYRDNAMLTEILSNAAHECDIRMVYISSTGVYGNHKDTPYHEYDEVYPTTHHHRAKLFGEVAVLRDCRALVLRVGWLFGGDPANRKNFIARRIEDALGCKTEMLSNNEQKGCPTYANDVAERLLYLLELNQSGLFNCVNSGSSSRFEYVESIIKMAGLNVPVKPVSAGLFLRKAQVSNNEMAINLKQGYLGFPPMRDWREALREYIDDRILPKLYS